jgi:hypothetical protein
MKTGIPYLLFAFLACECCASSAEECKIVQEKSVGSTAQGGYSFDYYSGRGRNCRVYKLRNHPGRLKTPVLWRSGAEVFLGVILNTCLGSAKACDWIAISKPSWKPYGDTSLLSYGLLKDEYEEKPETYVEAQRQASVGGDVRPLITTISGPITDAAGESVQIGIRVTSHATRNAENAFQLKYVFTQLPNGAETEIGTTETRAEGAGITLVWQSVESPSFVSSLAKIETRKLRPELTVEIVSPSIEVSWNQLILEQRGKPILTTTAPAYRSKEN